MILTFPYKTYSIKTMHYHIQSLVLKMCIFALLLFNLIFSFKNKFEEISSLEIIDAEV